MQIRFLNSIHAPISQFDVVAFMRGLRLEKIQVGWVVVSFVLINMMSCFISFEVTANDRLGNEDMLTYETFGTTTRVLRTQPEMVTAGIVFSPTSPFRAFTASRYIGESFLMMKRPHVFSPVPLLTIDRTELCVGTGWASELTTAAGTEGFGAVRTPMFGPATTRTKPSQLTAVAFSWNFDPAVQTMLRRNFFAKARIFLTVSVVTSPTAVFLPFTCSLKFDSALFASHIDHQLSIVPQRCGVNLYNEVRVIV